MIDLALKFAVGQLNDYLLGTSGSDFGSAQLCRLSDDAGKWAVTEDHIGVSVIHIEEERITRAQLPEPQFVGGSTVLLQPPLKLNLHVMFAANFKNYDQSLKYISHVLTYFQCVGSFTSDEYPALDTRIERLVVELQPLGYEQLNQIWAFIGTKQLVSAIYKFRMVVLQGQRQQAIQPPIREIVTAVHG